MREERNVYLVEFANFGEHRRKVGVEVIINGQLTGWRNTSRSSFWEEEEEDGVVVAVVASANACAGAIISM